MTFVSPSCEPAATEWTGPRRTARRARPWTALIAQAAGAPRVWFGTLTGSVRYFCSLPTDVRGSWRHVFTVRSFAEYMAAAGPRIVRSPGEMHG